MPIISIAMQKGGTGKTTTALNLAAAWQLQGKKILLVDLDPQANLTQALGVADDSSTGIYGLLQQAALGKMPNPEDSIIETDICPLLPAGQEPANQSSAAGPEDLLARILQPIKDQYDFILIDCPVLGTLSLHAQLASDYVLLPLPPEFLPFKSVQKFIKNLETVKQEYGKAPDLLGIILTRCDMRKQMHLDIKLQLERLYPGKVFPSIIRSNIALARAQELGTSIFSLNKRATGASDYKALAIDIIKKIPAGQAPVKKIVL